eukprot:6195581-Amphidinium_carterae.2
MLVPRFGKSLLSALAFSGGVLGVDGALVAAQSGRNVGNTYQVKGPLKQTPGLRVVELGSLRPWSRMRRWFQACLRLWAWLGLGLAIVLDADNQGVIQFVEMRTK